MLQMGGLLIHSQDVPDSAREALLSARSAPAAERRSMLLQAAKILHLDLGLDCEDAVELVGLGGDGECD